MIFLHQSEVIITIITLDEHYELTMEALDVVSKACVVANDESVPHQCNQSMIFSSGTMYCIMLVSDHYYGVYV